MTDFAILTDLELRRILEYWRGHDHPIAEHRVLQIEDELARRTSPPTLPLAGFRLAEAEGWCWR